MQKPEQAEPANFVRRHLFRLKRFIQTRPEVFRRERRMNEWIARELPLLRQARLDHEHEYTTNDQPLVSVPIATYNRAQLLTERSVASVLNQTYQNFELIIVGDGCSDDTPERIARIGDPRIRFLNLPERGKYPELAYHRWMVAGCYPGNKGLEMVKGKWISYIDDDDTWTPDHIESMLALAYEKNVEFVHAQSNVEDTPGVWRVYGEPDFPTGRAPYKGRGMPHSAVMYRSYLRLFKYDSHSYEIDRATDYWLWHRMSRAGVRHAFLPRIVAGQPLRPNEAMLTMRATRPGLEPAAAAAR